LRLELKATDEAEEHEQRRDEEQELLVSASS